MQGIGFHLQGRESKLDPLGGAGGRRLELRGWSASMHEALGLNPSTIWCMPVILVLGRWKHISSRPSLGDIANWRLV